MRLLFILFFFITISSFSQTQFGVLCGDCDNKTQASKTLGTTWIRLQVELKSYTGKNILQRYYDSGINVITTIKWSSGVDTFLTDTSKYKLMLDSFVKVNYSEDKLFLVCCNEELNKEHNFGTAQDYLNQLNAAITIASKYNLPIANGGLSFSTLKVGIYVSMMDNHDWDKAGKFGNTCIPKKTISRLQNKHFGMWDNIHFCDSIIDGLSKITYGKFYVNFHYYAPAIYKTVKDSSIVSTIIKDTALILKTTVNWLKEKTNRDSLHIICNEMGQYNSSPELLRSMIRNAKNNGIQIVIWNTGDDDGVYSLFSDYNDLSLSETGKAFKKVISK